MLNKVFAGVLLTAMFLMVSNYPVPQHHAAAQSSCDFFVSVLEPNPCRTSLSRSCPSCLNAGCQNASWKQYSGNELSSAASPYGGEAVIEQDVWCFDDGGCLGDGPLLDRRCVAQPGIEAYCVEGQAGYYCEYCSAQSGTAHDMRTFIVSACLGESQ
jgi:hypothetical protein